MIVTQNTKLNVVPGGIIPVVHVSQYDVDREISFTLYDGNGAAVLDNGTTVSIEGTKPDGHGFSYAGTLTNNVASFNTTQQMTVLVGAIECKLTLRKDSQVIGTAMFILDVEKAGINDDTDISETEIPMIVSLATEQMERAEAAAVSANASMIASGSSALIAGNAAAICSSILPVVRGYAESAENNAALSGSYMRVAGQSAEDAEYWAHYAEQHAGTGHVIVNENGESMPQRTKLKFINCEITDDSTNDTTIVEAEGGGSAVVGILSITTNNSAFYGQTITVSLSGSSVATGTFNNSGTATINVTGAGIYAVSVTAYGATVSQNVTVTASDSYNVALNSDTILGAWLYKGGLDYTDYADFSEVEADEKAVRRLMTIHASVDYLAECASASDSLALSIINSDICAKWINLRDYALDTLYANTYLASMMDTADKYFYGEWVITDSTTTPVTWGAKGNVPVMTGNSAPYGEASASAAVGGYNAWKVFDGNNSTFWTPSNSEQVSTSWIRYKFTNPVIVKRVQYVNRSDRTPTLFNFKIQGSNDGTAWTDIFNGTNSSTTGGIIESFDINNNTAYLYYGIYFLEPTMTNGYTSLSELQFYGRELRESVPVMTSNTAPYGEVTQTSYTAYGDQFGWKAFDGNFASNNGWCPEGSDTFNTAKVVYQFVNPICVREAKVLWAGNLSSYTATNKILASNDGTTWTELTSFTVTGATATVITIDNNDSYKYYAMMLVDNTRSDHVPTAGAWKLQFYGLNYTEYDWDTDHPRHYLYDHGVEPNETVQTQKGSNGEITKRANGEYYLKQVGTAVADRVGIGINTDLTSYSLGRCSIGSTNLLTSNDGVGLWVFSTSLVAGTVSSVYIYPTICNLPYAIGLDLSSVNGNYYYSASINTNNLYLTITELWLE